MSPRPRILLAVPTIPERRYLHDQLETRWRTFTPEPLEIVYSEAGESWGDGLNDIWHRIRRRKHRPSVLVCGSDDMAPATDRWLPAAERWLSRGVYPVPRVTGPRFDNWGGPKEPQLPVREGTRAFMSSFPVLSGDWLDTVFPLPDRQHYFADNLLAASLWLAGVKAVCVPSCHILHLRALEGRGAGHGNESTRLHIDTVRYTRALAARGVDRLTLPAQIRGHMFEPEFQAIGVKLGA